MPHVIDSPVLYARVLMPPGARKVCTNSYPMLFYVYGGPNSQMVCYMLQLIHIIIILFNTIKWKIFVVVFYFRHCLKTTKIKHNKNLQHFTVISQIGMYMYMYNIKIV